MRGVYGLRLEGLDGAAALLAPTDDRWPLVRVRRQRLTGPLREQELRPGWARLSLPEAGFVELDWHARVAAFHLSGATGDEELVHPFLALPAAVFNRWLDRESFHAGAFLHDGGAWAVLGPKGAGKSSLLAILGTRGTPVLADDVLVVDDGLAMPGPACVDLRPDAAGQVGAGDDLGVVGARSRWRVRVPGATAPVRLCGFVVPSWASSVAVEPMPPGERLTALLANLALYLPPRAPARLLELAALPCWRFSRPRAWATARDSAARLLESLAG